MRNHEIADKIKNILSERFGIDRSRLSNDARLRELGVDSLHVVEILVDLEEELGIKLEDLAVPPNPSLQEVAEAIARNMTAG